MSDISRSIRQQLTAAATWCPSYGILMLAACHCRLQLLQQKFVAIVSGCAWYTEGLCLKLHEPGTWRIPSRPGAVSDGGVKILCGTAQCVIQWMLTVNHTPVTNAMGAAFHLCEYNPGHANGHPPARVTSRVGLEHRIGLRATHLCVSAAKWNAVYLVTMRKSHAASSSLDRRTFCHYYYQLFLSVRSAF